LPVRRAGWDHQIEEPDASGPKRTYEPKRKMRRVDRYEDIRSRMTPATNPIVPAINTVAERPVPLAVRHLVAAPVKHQCRENDRRPDNQPNKAHRLQNDS
jgi:hypothetical protein